MKKSWDKKKPLTVKDQMLEPYLLEEENVAKWYKKLFRSLFSNTQCNGDVLAAAK